MKFFYLFLLFWRPFAGWAYDLPADVDLGMPFQKEALANSLRCLETILGDEERIARTRIFVAENLAYFGDEQAAITLLRGSRPHYHVPSGCVDSAMVFLGHGQRNAVRQLLNLALDLLPFAAGRGAELVQFQILRMATVTGDKNLLDRAWEAEKLTQTDLRRPYQAFLQDWQPNLWNQALDRLFPDRHWRDLQTKATRDEEIAWKAERAVDFYSGLIFLREAEARVRAGRSYPASWIRFVEAGIRSPAVNTRPAGLSAELAELAVLEKRPKEALVLVEETWKLLGGWAPVMTGIYRIERDLALVLAAVPGAESQREEAKGRIAKRTDILRKHLDPYEQILQLPLLAEALYALGDLEQSAVVWKTAAELCAQNQNPESQSIGLTRIWMSFARANTWPAKETEVLLLQTENRLPAAYSKVKF
jgi:hypothetical protein